MSFGLARGKALDVGGVGIEMRTLPSPDDGLIDPRSWFEDPSKPLEIEIGSGKGTFLLQEAKQRSEVNYLGFEWAGEFYRYAADRIRRNHLNNAKVVYGDATEFLKFWCKEQIADVIHLYFSDPWPKKRHHKRRVSFMVAVNEPSEVYVAVSGKLSTPRIGMVKRRKEP